MKAYDLARDYLRGTYKAILPNLAFLGAKIGRSGASQGYLVFLSMKLRENPRNFTNLTPNSGKKGRLFKGEVGRFYGL